MADEPLTDPIVEAVCADLRRRSAAGLTKYGQPLSRTDLSYRKWVEHAYEEALDLANYLRRLLHEEDIVAERALARLGDNQEHQQKQPPDP